MPLPKPCSLLLALTTALLLALTSGPAFADDDDSAADDDDDSAADDDDDSAAADDDDSAGGDDDDDDDSAGPVDADGDGYSGADDCDDSDPALYVDDLDGDGFTPCDDPGDCDDSSGLALPGGTEVCGDGFDNDCLGGDEVVDVDGDGALDPSCGGADCDDADSSVSPLLVEEGLSCSDSIDNDCDGALDQVDPSCFVAPVADAGEDQQQRYIGGTVVIVFDGSGTSDDNPDDVQSYQWVLDTPTDAYAGVAVSWATETGSPFAFLSLHADAAAAEGDWVFEAHLLVTDSSGLSSDPEDEDARATARISRVSFYPTVACGQSASRAAGAGPAALLALGLAFGLRRRRTVVGSVQEPTLRAALRAATSGSEPPVVGSVQEPTLRAALRAATSGSEPPVIL